jgi:hypothetical protein
MTGAFSREVPSERPRTPDASYGVPTDGGEMVDWTASVERLRTAEAYWLATTGPDGAPHVVPIWGVLVDGDLFLETGGADTAKARHLAINPAVAVHLDGTNDTLIVHGRAIPCRPDPALATSLVEAMRIKYRGYSPGPTDWDGGGLHRLEPRVMLAWRDMPTATRWRFPPAR